MEEERFRQKEPEPKLHDYAWNEDRFLRWAGLKKLFDKAPRVRHFDDVPWAMMHQACHKTFTGAEAPERELWLKRAPILSIGARFQVLKPGESSGKHRHFGEAVFYILEGKGYEIHDGKRYDWEAGDLMCVPTYAYHQHFADPETGATIFFSGRGCLAQSLNLGGMEQEELKADFQLPAGSEPLKDPEGRLIGYRRKDGVEIPLNYSSVSREVMDRKARAAPPPEKIETTYDEYIQQYWEESRWRQSCPHRVRAKELPWEDTRQGRIKYLVHPKIPIGLLTFDCFLQEIPPGGWSGKHCHVGEEVQFIIEGEGYSVLDGVRWDWSQKDLLCIPVMTTHQHFNSDPKRPVRFISLQSRLYSFIGHGGIEHLEDASSYRAKK